MYAIRATNQYLCVVYCTQYFVRKERLRDEATNSLQQSLANRGIY